MRILILTDDTRDAQRADVLDVLDQARAVREGLTRLGHEVREACATADWDALRRAVCDAPTDLVFNLVESFLGHGRLIGIVPEFLEALGVPYTGSAADVLRSTSDKVAVKRRLRALGLPTPDHVDPADPPLVFQAGTYIVKSLWEHASLGLDDESVVTVRDLDQLLSEIARRRDALGGSAFAERYVPGREFNLSLLATPEGPRVLPPAEILFEGFGAGKPRIVGYRAKWDPASVEYHRTPRTFAFEPSDGPLLERLSTLARRTWDALGVRGFARVDFRVDEHGEPWILEINANPCLAPDAGFHAALERAGLSFDQALAAILTDVPRA